MKVTKEIILVSWGGIGDAIVCTPAIESLRAEYPEKKIILYCTERSHLEVFKHNPNVDSVRFMSNRALLRYPYHFYAFSFNRSLIKPISLYFQHILPPDIYDKSIKEVIADIFPIKLRSNRTSLFLTQKEEAAAAEKMRRFQNVVLLHIQSRSSINHHWALCNWAKLVSELPEYTFIQIGSGDEAAVTGAVDWRGRTSLREAFALFKYAKSFVGVDSSFAHVTNCFNTPGVVLFGDSSPVYWGHDNNINIYKNKACSPCYYDLWNNPCPYDHSCMKDITVDEVKRAIINQMKKH